MFSEQQIFLLKAALLPVDDALVYWKKWKGLNAFTTDDVSALRQAIFDPLDIETQKLLPQVHYNLKNYVAEDMYLKAIKSTTRYDWVRSQRLWFSFKKLVVQLNRQGTRPMLFKGGVSALAYYPEKNIRVLSDLDIFFQKDAHTVIREELLKYGCTTNFYFSEQYSPLIFHAVQYSNSETDDFDVHAYFLHEHLYPEANELLCKNKVEYSLGAGAQIYFPSPTVHFFLTLIHGTRNRHVTRTLCVTDIYRLLAIEHNKIDWDELLFLLVYFKYETVAAQTLPLLNELFNLDIPLYLIEKVKTAPVDAQIKQFLETRDQYHSPHLTRAWKNFKSCASIYRLFMYDRVDYTFFRWIFNNYAYKIEKFTKDKTSK